ncbi:MAG: glycoside hydrolase [Planctomycetota bacterium]|nr:MAG: glycoside hydrolase [Planctomycetota bacterium]
MVRVLLVVGMLLSAVSIPAVAKAVVVDVRDVGAVGDGRTDDTAAIQKAIDACAENGGGRVDFPPGRYLAGSVRLKSRIEMHFAEGAVLVGTSDLDAYFGFEHAEWGKSRWHRGLIVGEGLENVAFTGSGIIDGGNVRDPRGEAGLRGPHTILLADCSNVVLDGLTVANSGNYAFLFYASNHVRVKNATFQGGWDGVHFRGSADRWNKDVRIEDCRFYTGDDCIAGHYIEDAVVQRCFLNSSCNGVRLIGPARRLTFESCRFQGPGKFEHQTKENLHRTNMLAGIILQPSAWTPTPGPLEDIRIADVSMSKVACALHVSIREGNTANRITVERLSAVDVYASAVSFESWAEPPIGRVTLRDVRVHYTPDAVIDPRLGRPPKVQDPIRKPGVGVWNRKLPVWGLYARRVEDLRVDGLEMTTTDEGEARPAILLHEVPVFRLGDPSRSAKPPMIEHLPLDVR